MDLKKLLINGKKILNRIIQILKEKVIEKVVIGKEFDELSESALNIAKREADEEFQRRWESEKKTTLNKKSKIQMETYKIWVNERKGEYNEMVKEAYNKHLADLKRMWLVRDNMDRLFPRK